MRSSEGKLSQYEDKIKLLLNELESLRNRLEESERDRRQGNFSQEKLKELVVVVELRQKELDEAKQKCFYLEQ